MKSENFASLGIAMVKNEADVIEAFVRHNLSSLDVLVVADNDSVDGTREILLALQSEGLPIVIFDDPIFGYFQSEKLTFLYRRVVPLFKPRYVFLLDADEFIVAHSREELDAELSTCPPGSQATYCWRTYVPGPDRPLASDVLREVTHRRVNEEPPYRKSIVVCRPDLDPRLVIAQGSHNVGLEFGGALDARPLKSAALAHFPVRSMEQVQSKVLTGWLAYLTKQRVRRVSGEGFHWQTLYEKCLSKPGLSTEDVTREALAYAQSPSSERLWPTDVVQDPVTPHYGSLIHGGMGLGSVLTKLARTCERQIVPHPRYAFDVQPTHENGGHGPTAAEPAADGPRVATAFGSTWHSLNLYLDLPPFRHIGERVKPRSILDLGCGLGGYLRFFANLGAERVVGVDGFPAELNSLIRGTYLHRDLGERLDLGESFDLVMCTEVIEHLGAEHEEVVLDNIVRHANTRIVFSGADVGQPGLGHVNCRPITHWLERFAVRGWSPDLLDTLAMRSLATFSWFRRNLVVLTQRADGGAMARQKLAEISSEPTQWPHQRAAVVTHAFSVLGGS